MGRSVPHECFADEIAIDFPSVGRVVERMRADFLGPGGTDEDHGELDVLSTEVSVSRHEAQTGLDVPIDVPVRTACGHCGGRGETWTEPCVDCCGTGDSLVYHPVRVSVPPGVADGATFRFRLSSRGASSVRVEVRVAIRAPAR